MSPSLSFVGWGLALEQVAIDLDARLKKARVSGQTLTLKVKFVDYSQVTRSMTQTVAFTEVRSIQASRIFNS